MIDFNSFDDAAAYSVNGSTILQTVDFFTPIVNDPFDFGRIAAANSLSDIYAMGGTPLFALNIVGFPSDDLPLDVLSDILAGGAETASRADISIMGGHSIKDKEPKYGMVVTGIANSAPCKNSSAKNGDILFLTKPLGLGIISTAIKKDIASDKLISEAVDVMTTLNKEASVIMMDVGVNACTDVTGYGLLGHLLEMSKASNITAKINFDSFGFIDGAKEHAYDGVVPGGTKRNYEFVKDSISFSSDIDMTEKYLLADAQTSGGLLISVSQNNAKELESRLTDSGCMAIEIGEIQDYSESFIKVSR